MKILIVNTIDTEGGAARAAYRLHHSLILKNVSSQMLVQNKVSDEMAILGPLTKTNKLISKIRPLLDLLPLRKYKKRTRTLFSPSWIPFSSIVDRINSLNPDIVHLHWVNGGMIRIEDIARIKAPVVWTLHDMWPFTGGCHYNEFCESFKNHCGNCKVLGSSRYRDLSFNTFSRKQKTFAKKKDITVIGLSRWLVNQASSSALFRDYPVINLPNPIDTRTFSPFDKKQSRELLNLPLNKKLILFGAMGATSDPRKGFIELSQALQELQNEDAELVVFGSSQPEKNTCFKQKAHYLGRINDDITLRLLYSASDVMVVPSIQENLSNAIMESLSCGTPVVGFNIGGNSDLIEHKINGYLAAPYNTADLAEGIDWVIENGNIANLTNNARQKVLDKFDNKIVAEQYISLYRDILKKEK